MLSEAKSRKAGSFKEYRQKKGYSEKSIRVQYSHVNSFKSWCIRENINPSDITYNQTLKFIDSEKERGISRQSIIREINSIRIYFDYLMESGMTHQDKTKRKEGSPGDLIHAAA